MRSLNDCALCGDPVVPSRVHGVKLTHWHRECVEDLNTRERLGASISWSVGQPSFHLREIMAVPTRMCKACGRFNPWDVGASLYEINVNGYKDKLILHPECVDRFRSEIYAPLLASEISWEAGQPEKRPRRRWVPWRRR